MHSILLALRLAINSLRHSEKQEEEENQTIET